MRPEEFGPFLAEQRKKRALTQTELAEKLHISTAAVSKWERGKCLPEVAKLEEKYGLLKRYATKSERGAVTEEHTLELWSAHFHSTDGTMWVYYSKEAYDAQGQTLCGSWKIPSLWYLEKNETGQWKVVAIKEHP